MAQSFEQQLDLSGKIKPFYADGKKVNFDLGTVKGTGKIRGLSSRHLVDMWIVEIETAEGLDKSYYPWSCMVIQHTALSALP